MSLYRLHYLNDDGSTAESVQSPTMGGDFLSQHASTARAVGTETAVVSGRAILMERIVGAGVMRPTLVIEPDGTCKPPAGMKSDHDSDARVCFCAACRAQRVAARRMRSA